MATMNPISISKSPNLQIAVKQCMIEFAKDILINETPITSPTSGYKAYDKRMALAKQVIQNPDLYVEMASRLVATIFPNIEVVEWTGLRIPMFWFMSNLEDANGVGNFMSLVVTYDAYNGGGLVLGSIGSQLWDALAGVTAADLL